ncbi:MAG: hypothetical protein KA267_11260 [Gemmatimonadales bacterium]|nr:hypothetical protein [Gemmatimonadales bacterium]MBP6569885.1 hypothetical protein [Gemmatimonadales bacterium]MBP7622150.1 hypothetical protein [Gemmatimonadales bacterium]
MSIRPLCVLVVLAVSMLSTFGPASAQSTWGVVPKPIFELGAESEDTLETFGEVRGVTRLPNGDVVIADIQAFSLRIFTAAGVFRRSVGRRGDGPGEFQAIMKLYRCGDSLFVQEWGEPLMKVFHNNGSFGRNATFLSPQKAGGTGYSTSCNPNRIFINSGWEVAKDRKVGPFRATIPFWLNDADGKVLRVLAESPGNERLGLTGPGGRLGGSGPMPLGRLSVVAIGSARAYVGTADSFAINVFDLNGRSLPSLRLSPVDVRTTPADIAEFVRSDTAGHSKGAIERSLKMFAELKWPATLPTYSALVVDSEDHLWVQRFPRAREAVAHWAVFTPNGKEIAKVDLPRDLVVAEIGKDYVLGVAKLPPDGVDHVRVYRLMRR